MKNCCQNIRTRFSSFWWGSGGPSAHLLLLLLLFMLAPLLASELGTFLSALFFSLILLAGIASVSNRLLLRLLELQLPGSLFITPTAAGQSVFVHETEFTYFSFVTLTTLGYGDIIPVHPTARMFVIIEALIGQLFPATLLARLVSLQISRTVLDSDQ